MQEEEQATLSEINNEGSQFYQSTQTMPRLKNTRRRLDSIQQDSTQQLAQFLYDESGEVDHLQSNMSNFGSMMHVEMKAAKKQPPENRQMVRAAAKYQQLQRQREIKQSEKLTKKLNRVLYREDDNDHNKKQQVQEDDGEGNSCIQSNTDDVERGKYSGGRPSATKAKASGCQDKQ